MIDRPQGSPQSEPARDPALRILLVLATVYAIYLAKSILLPLAVALLLTFLLRPIARGMVRIKIPSTLAAVVLVVALIGAVGSVGYFLIDPVSEWGSTFPQKIHKLEHRFRSVQERAEKVTEAAEKVEALTEVSSSGPRANPKVEVVDPEKGWANILLTGTGELIGALMVILALTFFLIASGETFLERLVRFLPLHEGRGAYEVLADIERHASRYVLTISAINVALGLAIGLGLWALGLPNPLLWGTLACVLNFVPYLGAMTGVAIVSAASLLAFDDIGRVLACGGLYFFLTFVEGTFVTPMILGQRLTLNPLVVFLNLLFWGSLWGIPGVLIAVPMLAVFKLVTDEVPSLRGLSELLGAYNVPSSPSEES